MEAETSRRLVLFVAAATSRSSCSCPAAMTTSAFSYAAISAVHQFGRVTSLSGFDQALEACQNGRKVVMLAYPLRSAC